MSEYLKYNPLRSFQTSNPLADSVDNILSVKMETNLENKIQVLMKKLIISEDTHTEQQLGLEIKNIQKDIEDIQKTRNSRIKKSRENNEHGHRSRFNLFI